VSPPCLTAAQKEKQPTAPTQTVQLGKKYLPDLCACMLAMRNQTTHTTVEDLVAHMATNTICPNRNCPNPKTMPGVKDSMQRPANGWPNIAWKSPFWWTELMHPEDVLCWLENGETLNGLIIMPMNMVAIVDPNRTCCCLLIKLNWVLGHN
jgi:hypothetical protein